MSAQTAPTGPCLACGKASTLRCSSCSAKSKIDFFFCSKAHQKLLWPYHRFVCGDRAHPFRLPAYSQEEVDVLLERLRTSTNRPQFYDLQEKMRFALNASEMSQSALNDKVQSLIGQDGLLPTPKSGSSSRRPSSDAELIRDLRLLSWQWYSQVYRSEDGEHPVQHFVEYFTQEYLYLTQDAPPVDCESAWHSRFCHQLAALIAIKAKALQCTDGVFAAASHGAHKSVDLSEASLTPDGCKTMLQLNGAYSALLAFLTAAEETEYAYFAMVVRYNNIKSRPGVLGAGQ